MGLFVLDAGHGTDFITTHSLCTAQCTVSSVKCEHHAQFDYNIKRFTHSATFIFTLLYNYTSSQQLFCVDIVPWTISLLLSRIFVIVSNLNSLLVTQYASFTNTITVSFFAFFCIIFFAFKTSLTSIYIPLSITAKYFCNQGWWICVFD